ncbi:hypothetical protein FOXB_05551 [Fusarium oxysporum f. sp. conglutinans Fo5176]|uniref:Uncharacterized protein n=1 Tax=Fusarium oxysporum (strain Fo5176) TaxID=660025 RepID=F9FGM2_FUSOF|nr:hypothetical protein FOXB_05551 [Fusarium oxysporum f. sp. conglutinans Fo5176]
MYWSWHPLGCRIQEDDIVRVKVGKQEKKTSIKARDFYSHLSSA